MQLVYEDDNGKLVYIELWEELDGQLRFKVWYNDRKSPVFKGFQFDNPRPATLTFNQFTDAVRLFYAGKTKAKNALENNLTHTPRYGMVDGR